MHNILVGKHHFFGKLARFVITMDVARSDKKITVEARFSPMNVTLDSRKVQNSTNFMLSNFIFT